MHPDRHAACLFARCATVHTHSISIPRRRVLVAFSRSCASRPSCVSRGFRNGGRRCRDRYSTFYVGCFGCRIDRWSSRWLISESPRSHGHAACFGRGRRKERARRDCRGRSEAGARRFFFFSTYFVDWRRRRILPQRQYIAPDGSAHTPAARRDAPSGRRPRQWHDPEALRQALEAVLS